MYLRNNILISKLLITNQPAVIFIFWVCKNYTEYQSHSDYILLK